MLIDRLKNMLRAASESDTEAVQRMKDTVEDSPWHREANVWVHTEMVVGEFIQRWSAIDPEGSDRNMFCAGLAALFHDFGKPAAEETAVNAEGRVYRRYSGHEGISTGMFVHLSLSQALWMQLFAECCDLSDGERYLIAVMIEHHLPYKYSDALIQGVLDTINWFAPVQVFATLITSDCHGRISDDHDKKKNDVVDWIGKHINHYQPTEVIDDPDASTAYILVGPSGAGKTTARNVLGVSADMVFCMDDIRLSEYPLDDLTADMTVQYHYAFTQASANKDDFNTAMTVELTRIMNASKKSSTPALVMSDNTNLSRKSRRQFIAAAKQRGMHVMAVVLLPHIENLRESWETRTDKQVPWSVVERQVHALRFPLASEVDSVMYSVGQ